MSNGKAVCISSEYHRINCRIIVRKVSEIGIQVSNEIKAGRKYGGSDILLVSGCVGSCPKMEIAGNHRRGSPPRSED
jgi:hypothetical protein